MFFYGFNSTFWLTRLDTTETIPTDKFYVVNLPGVETDVRVHSEYTASNEIIFYILDEYNYYKLETFLKNRIWTDYQFIHHSVGESESYTFSAPKYDTYYIVLFGSGDNDVSVAVKILIERVWIKGMLYVFALLIFVPIGLVGIIGGLRAKPKVEQVASKLLDVMKLYERMKISELATRFKTSEADIESALIKLKSRGEPIQFDVETREVIYTPSKEE